MLDVNEKVLVQVIETITNNIVNEFLRPRKRNAASQTRPVILDLDKHEVKFQIYLDTPKN